MTTPARRVVRPGHLDFEVAREAADIHLDFEAQSSEGATVAVLHLGINNPINNPNASFRGDAEALNGLAAVAIELTVEDLLALAAAALTIAAAAITDKAARL